MADKPIDLSGGVPLLLSATVTLSEGETQLADARRLQNEFRSPMMLDEIHFSVLFNRVIETYPFQLLTISTGMGGSVSVRMKMGTVDLHDKFTPVWLHGPRLASGLFDVAGGIASNWYADPESEDFFFTGLTAVNADTRGMAAYYRWILPKPLYVPAGNVVMPTFSRSNDGMGGTVDVNVAYGCRRLPVGTPQPKEVDVPYVVAYLPDNMTGATGAPIFRASGAKDLYNPFNVPFMVQRMIGRSYTFNDSVDDGGQLGASTPLPFTMQDSQGYTVVRSQSQALDLNRYAWTFNRALAPKEWFALQFRTTAIFDYDYYAQFSMVGYRKEYFG